LDVLQGFSAFSEAKKFLEEVPIKKLVITPKSTKKRWNLCFIPQIYVKKLTITREN